MIVMDRKTVRAEIVRDWNGEVFLVVEGATIPLRVVRTALVTHERRAAIDELVQSQLPAVGSDRDGDFQRM